MISSSTSSLFKAVTLLLPLIAVWMLKKHPRGKPSSLVSLNLWTFTICFFSILFMLNDWLMLNRTFAQSFLVTSANSAVLQCKKAQYNHSINYTDSVLIKAPSTPICSVSHLRFQRSSNGHFSLALDCLSFEHDLRATPFYITKKSSFDSREPVSEIKNHGIVNHLHSIQSLWQTLLWSPINHTNIAQKTSTVQYELCEHTTFCTLLLSQMSQLFIADIIGWLTVLHCALFILLLNKVYNNVQRGIYSVHTLYALLQRAVCGVH